jgi:hypothetical protein
MTTIPQQKLEAAKARYAYGMKLAMKKFNPDTIGNCHEAAAFMVARYPELKEEIVLLQREESNITHCIVVTEDGFILDTQHKQFKSVIKLNPKYAETYVFTREQHEDYLPRFEYGN